jgi:hypothetical protein
MNKALFQIMGGFTVAFAGGLIFMGLYTMTGWSVHLTLPPSMSPLVFWLRLLALVIPFAVVGTGLLRWVSS